MIPERGFYGLLGPLWRDQSPEDCSIVPPALPLGSGRFRGNAWNTGRQVAYWYSTDDASLACCGEIYNSHELRRQLELTADAPLSRVLLFAWRRWALDFVVRFDGVFVMALHCEDGLTLYRDPSGLFDLYYCSGTSGRINLASHLGTLLRLPGVEYKLARPSLHEYLRFGDIAAPNTMFDGVRAVEAGQLLRWGCSGIEASPAPGTEPEGESTEAFTAAVDALEAHLKRSVSARLADARQPAAFLSGGIDSALICALASRQRPETTAVTVGFGGTSHDEAPRRRPNRGAPGPTARGLALQPSPVLGRFRAPHSAPWAAHR